MSSYQCDDLMPQEGPPCVVFGRLFPEHLDWHGDLKNYYAAKAKLLIALPKGGQVFIDAQAYSTLQTFDGDPKLYESEIQLVKVNDPSGVHFLNGCFWDGEQKFSSDDGMRIPGQHNRDNACLAYAAARSKGVPISAFQSALHQFSGLPYRLQHEGRHAGIDWINDSISTAPEAACAALEAFGIGGTTTLIVGGQDRGYDYHPLLQAICLFKVSHVILIPESGEKIGLIAQSPEFQDVLKTIPSRFHFAPNLKDAVELAAQLTPKDGRCVFSPAAPSYHQWSGFEARGQDYRSCIELLTDLKPS